MNEKRKGRWSKGTSGNPAGRGKGKPDRRSAWRAELGEALPGILRKLVESALAGCTQSAALVLSRVASPLRPSREPVEVKGIDPNASATDTAQELIAAAVRGDLPTDAAAELVAALGTVAKLREVDELARRIAALESRQ